MKNDNFRNTPSERFFSFFTQKIERKETSITELADVFGKYKSNPWTFLNSIRVGNMSVTVEMILIAQKNYQLDPCTLFDKKVNWAEGKLVYVQEFYDDSYKTLATAKRLGKQLQDLLKKHAVNIKEYAERLGMTEQNLYKQLRGEGRIYADTLITVCKDLNEPLEQFRAGILAQSHTLEKLRFCEETIRAKNETIEALKAQIEGKKNTGKQ